MVKALYRGESSSQNAHCEPSLSARRGPEIFQQLLLLRQTGLRHEPGGAHQDELAHLWCYSGLQRDFGLMSILLRSLGFASLFIYHVKKRCGRTFSGWAPAKATATAPPIEKPKKCADSIPKYCISSSICVFALPLDMLSFSEK